MTEKPFFQLTNSNDEKQKSPLPPDPRNAVTIAISPRTLFNMVAESGIYQNQGVEKYIDYQVEHENEIMGRGDSFPFVKALMTVNSRLRELYPDSEELFDIVLMTNSHAQVGVRIINSINHYNLTIERFCMTGGQSPIGYLKAYNTNLYLSKDPEKVTEAIKAEIAAATMYSPDYERELSDSQLRVAFDGDAVLFSDESEKVLKQEGLKNFFAHEKRFEDIPLAQGPLKGFLESLGKLQKKFYAKDERNDCPIRTFLVTARSAASSGARVIKTLRSWGLEIDEALFAAGAPKGPLLRKIKPHIFFDDQMFNIQGAKKMGTISAHVPYGIGQSQSYPQHASQHPSQHASQQQSGQSYQQQQSGPTQSYQQQQSGPTQSYQQQQSGPTQSYQQSESRQTYQHYPTHLSQ